MYYRIFGKYSYQLVREIYEINERVKAFDWSREQLYRKVGTTPDKLAAFKNELARKLPPIKPNPAYLTKSVFDLDVPARSHKYFRYLKVTTVAQLLNYSAKDLISLRNIGARTVRDIQRELKAHGYQLKNSQ